MSSRFRCYVRDFKQIRLTDGGLRIKHLPNAGGDSQESEVMSFEILHLIFGAELSR